MDTKKTFIFRPQYIPSPPLVYFIMLVMTVTTCFDIYTSISRIKTEIPEPTFMESAEAAVVNGEFDQIDKVLNMFINCGYVDRYLANKHGSNNE